VLRDFHTIKTKNVKRAKKSEVNAPWGSVRP
jgi:hypothetical protein